MLGIALQTPVTSSLIEGVEDWDIIIDVLPASGRTVLSATSSGGIVQLTKSGHPVLIAAAAHNCPGKALFIRVDQNEGILLGEQGRRNVEFAFKQMLTGREAVIAYHRRPCESIQYLDLNLKGLTETVEKLKNLPPEEIDALTASIIEEREKTKRDIEEGKKGGLGENLTRAAREGDLVKVIALLAQGADVNVRTETNGYTPLLWASSRGHTETVRTLVSVRVDVNAPANDGQTALMRACDNGRIDIVAIL